MITVERDQPTRRPARSTTHYTVKNIPVTGVLRIRCAPVPTGVDPRSPAQDRRPAAHCLPSCPLSGAPQTCAGAAAFQFAVH